MDASRFDAITRSLAAGTTRRAILRALAVVLLATLPRVASAKKDKKKPKKNAFGCLDVGQKCRGKNGKCCSGLCLGKKPQKGKKDKSRCVGHDASNCLVGQQAPACGGTETVLCTSSAGQVGRCSTTTGNAAFCRAASASACMACKKDIDCQTHCGPQTACIPCTGCAVGTACAGIDVESFACDVEV